RGTPPPGRLAGAATAGAGSLRTGRAAAGGRDHDQTGRVMSRTFRSLHVRNYRVYAMGSLVSNVGTWLQSTAQAWLVLVLTGSGVALGVTVALQLLPSLLFSPLGGLVADRFPKRATLTWLQVAMAVPAGALGV